MVVARIRETNPTDALTAVIHRLRPDWAPEAIHAALLNDRRPDSTAIPAAIHAALNPDMRHPNAMTTYAVRPTTESGVTFPRAARCPHGTLADPDGLGTDCDGCGTRVTPPDPALLAQLRAAASGPTRHTPEDA